IGAQAEPDTGADRRQRDVLTPLIIGADAANKIRRAVDAGIAMEDAIRTAQIVGEREYTRGVAAGVEADGRALPVNPRRAVAALQAQITVAITQSDTNRPRALIAFNVAVRAAQIVEDVVDNGGEPFGARAKETLRRGEDFILRISLLRLRQRLGRQEECSAGAQRKTTA